MRRNWPFFSGKSSIMSHKSTKICRVILHTGTAWMLSAPPEGLMGMEAGSIAWPSCPRVLPALGVRTPKHPSAHGGAFVHPCPTPRALWVHFGAGLGAFGVACFLPTGIKAPANPLSILVGRFLGSELHLRGLGSTSR